MPNTDLITQIYDCALQPDLWPATLQNIAHHVGALGAMVFDCDVSGPAEKVVLRLCSAVYDPQVVLGYVAQHNAAEVHDQARFARLSTAGNAVDLIRCDDLTASRAALEQQSNMQAMMQLGVHYRAGALLCKNTDAMDRFALQFTRKQGPISEGARVQVAQLLPHVAKSLSIGRSIWAAQAGHAALMQVIEALSFGVAICAKDGTILLANAEFDRLSAAHHLAAPQGRKLLVDRLPAALHPFFGGHGTHGKYGARPLYEGAALPLGVFFEVSPISQHRDFDRFGADTVVVTALDTARAHAINTAALARFFPISAAEVEVLESVIQGHTNAQIAEARGRSVETVGSQVKALIRKSGARNRTELVRIAVGLSASALKLGN